MLGTGYPAKSATLTEEYLAGPQQTAGVQSFCPNIGPTNQSPMTGTGI